MIEFLVMTTVLIAWLLRNNTSSDLSLSKNFELHEFTRTSYDVVNIPNEAQIENIKNLVYYVLQPLRDLIGSPINVSSGFRSPELNEVAGGEDDSQHMDGEAADIYAWFISTETLMRRLVESNIPYDQVILESDLDTGAKWIHVSFRFLGRRQALIGIRKNGHTEYSRYV